MLFSIIVPMFNSEKYIKDCIESVLRQTEKSFELIIIDDGSQDSCSDIVSEYATNDKRIKIISQKNAGSFHARIKGVDNASGEYVVFLDADDTLKGYMLERLKEHITSDKPDIIIFREESYNDKGLTSLGEKVFENGTIFEGDNKKLIYDKLIKDASLNHLWTKAIRLECFNNEKFRSFPSISMGDDVLYTLEPITNARKIIYIDEILYNYRVISTSLTRTFQPNIYSGFKIITNVKEEYLSRWKMKNEDYLSILYRRLLKNISGIAIYSPASIKDQEKEYLEVLKDIQSDPFFIKIYNLSFKDLSLIRKIPVFLLKNRYFKMLFYIKVVITKLQKIRYSR